MTCWQTSSVCLGFCSAPPPSAEGCRYTRAAEEEGKKPGVATTQPWQDAKRPPVCVNYRDGKPHRACRQAQVLIFGPTGPAHWLRHVRALPQEAQPLGRI